MRRWQLTLLLGAAAALAAALVPALRARAPAPTPRPERTDTIAEAAAADGPLTLAAALDRSAILAGGDGLRYLVVSVTAPEDAGARIPVDVAMVVDTSGSMGREGKIEAARSAADEFVDALRAGDRFALVSFDDQAHVLLGGQTFDGDASRLHRVIAGMRDDGGTNLGDGMERGRDELGAGSVARKVLLVSDGNANMGITEPGELARMARSYAADGVAVSAIGLGRDFNEMLLEGMADAGGGTYRFVGDPAELPSVISGELARTTATVARGARVHIAPASGVTLGEVYGWNADVAPDGVDVYVGDLSAGQTRKIVVEARVPAYGSGAEDVATARLDYADVGGVARHAGVAVSAIVTDDPGVVSASLDEAATVAATRARAGALTHASADALRRGDTAGARAILGRASNVLAEALDQVDSPELVEDQATMSRIERLNAAEGGAYAAKAASEAGRELAR